MSYILKTKSHTPGTNRGQAAIAVVLFLVGVTLVATVTTSATALKEEKAARTGFQGKSGYFLSEAAQEDVVYRLKRGKPVGTVSVLTLLGNSATTTITDVSSEEKEVVASGSSGVNIRKTQVALLRTLGASFFYGVQVGAGGLHMKNTASVVGNIFSNGPVTGENSNTATGDVISAGSGGLIDGVALDSSAYAATVRDSTVGADAYYQTIVNSTVGGTLHPGSEPLATTTMPLTDGQIADLEAIAESGGVINSPCPYQIKTDRVIGPVKINCDLKITGTPTVTIAGMLRVVGNVEVENSATLRLSSSLGSASAGIIADNPADRLTSSSIEVKNSVSAYGSGTPGSYVVFISQNRSAESGGSGEAIEMENTVSGDLLVYAPHGDVKLKNSISLKEVTAYKVTLENSAEVVYESGLSNVLFTTGPSGGYKIVDWKEIE